MSKRKLVYLLSAVSVTSVGAAALAYSLNNDSTYKGYEPLAKKEGFGYLNYKDEEKNLDKNTIITSKICSPEYTKSINKARDFVLRLKDEVGAPGIVIGVSVNGKTVWAEGMGMSDVENRVPCHPESVMRIASISKSITMAIVAKLWEEGKIDLDKPIQEYVPKFPVKTYDGKEVTITSKMLASHLSGIRHYTKKGEIESKDVQTRDTLVHEFYIKDRFESVDDALKLFQNDELLFNPGTMYHYSTHGYTLLSAAAEGAAKQPFTKLLRNVLNTLGMKNTYLDENDVIIYHRARYYSRNNRGRITNVPYADNSYKWAGGGLLSNVGDLLQFCNMMLHSYQHNSKLGTKPSFLQPKTVQTLWTPMSKEGYGLGWSIAPHKEEYQGCNLQRFSVNHSGGALGASSIVLMLPSNEMTELPSGIAVAIITNLQDVGLRKLGLEVAELFLKENQ